MGYGAGDFFAIDSYWISLSLDFGALGVVLYVGLFTVVIFAAVKTLLQHPEMARGETSLLIPLVSFLAAFLMIRGVYAEEFIHPLVFALLAMTVCLTSRAKLSVSASKSALVAAPTAAPTPRARGGLSRPPEQTRKPMSFAMIVVVMLACAVAYYLACAAWRLVH
jgi:hypothetical protein